MKRILCLTLLLLLFGISNASASSYLYDWAFNVNGTTYENFNGDSMPTTGSLDAQGLGNLTWSTNVAGSYNFIAFFDHEIDEDTNTWFNEIGSTSGSPGAGQSWEIDEPGYFFGDIYDNVIAGSLDGFNGVPDSAPDDVSMAMGWDFTLLDGETAKISLLLKDEEPISGFYLTQTDPDSLANIYFSGTIDIRGEQPIPEPATMILLGTGLAGLFGFGRKRFKK